MNLIIEYTQTKFTAEYIASTLSEYANVSKITIIPAYHLAHGTSMGLVTVYITIESWRDTNMALAAIEGLNGETHRFVVRHNNRVVDDFIIGHNIHNDGNISGLGKTTYFSGNKPINMCINDSDDEINNKEDMYPKHPPDTQTTPKNIVIPTREIAKDYVIP
jgi:hypothetical protein